MKKLAFIALVLVSVASIAYGSKEASVCDESKFLTHLDLQQGRAEKVREILRSYGHIKILYMKDRADEIPAFLAKKEAELAAVLSPEEMEQFKSDVAAWAKNKDFSRFMNFSSMGK